MNAYNFPRIASYRNQIMLVRCCGVLKRDSSQIYCIRKRLRSVACKAIPPPSRILSIPKLYAGFQVVSTPASRKGVIFFVAGFEATRIHRMELEPIKVSSNSVL